MNGKTPEWLSWLFAILLPVILGVAGGVGGYTFIYAKGYSYLSNDSKACANCHVMQEHFDSWNRASHHRAATCNDCHTPHSLIPKYWAKFRNGFNHSKAFTLQNFPEPIRITRKNLIDLQTNCIHCHETLVGGIAGHKEAAKGAARCTECHSSVGHMTN